MHVSEQLCNVLLLLCSWLTVWTTFNLVIHGVLRQVLPCCKSGSTFVQHYTRLSYTHGVSNLAGYLAWLLLVALATHAMCCCLPFLRKERYTYDVCTRFMHSESHRSFCCVWRIQPEYTLVQECLCISTASAAAGISVVHCLCCSRSMHAPLIVIPISYCNLDQA